MTMQLTRTPIGLDGIPAADTVLSHVDGEKGELIIAGERVGDLAATSSFEGVTARLWTAATGQRSARPKSAPRSATRANALSPGCRSVAGHAGLSIVDGIRAAIAALRAENGLEA